VEREGVAAPRGALEDPRGEDQLGGGLVPVVIEAQLPIMIPPKAVESSLGIVNRFT
jgi:hypothetical protein